MQSNPYVGPRAFRTGERLYGRDRELRRLRDLLIAERIVLLHAPSGAGKTSLVQAALVPALRAEGFVVLPPIRVSQEPAAAADPLLGALLGLGAGAPGAAPNRYLLSALLALEEGLPPAEQLPTEQLAALSLDDYLRRREAALAADDGLVLLFDQFEEILTTDPTDIAAKEAFFAQVGAALYNRGRWALFSMRDDYVGSVEPFVRPIPTQLANTFHLDLLDLASALESMQLPVKAAGGTFTDAAARQLADDLRRVTVMRADGSTIQQLGPYLEPVQLQVVCYRLWASMAEGDLSIDPEDVAALGNVDQALTGYYAERVAAIAAASGVHERAIRDWCERGLITEQGIRGQVPEGASELDRRAIAGLVDAHLVRGEQRRGTTWFELAHDRLIGPIQADNVRWREANLSNFQRQAALWERQDRPTGLLLRDETLREAEAWLAAGAAALTPSEQDFLAASHEAQAGAERDRRATRRIRALGITSAVAGLLALAVAIFAGWQWRQAEEQRRAAQAAQQAAEVRQLAAQAMSNVAQNPELALLLAVEMGRRSLDGSAQLGHEAIDVMRQVLTSAVGVGLGTSSAVVQELAFSPDGALLAARDLSDSSETLRLWRVGPAATQPLPVTIPISHALGLAFTAGPTLELATTAGLYRWAGADLTASPQIVPIPGLALQSGDQVVFSRDGRQLVIVLTSGQSAIYFWDTSAPSVRLLNRFALQDIWTPELTTFSPGGRFVAFTYNGAVAVWDRDEPALNARLLRNEGGEVSAFAFSPDERYLASVSRQGGGQLWDLSRPGAAPTPLPDSDQQPVAVAFSPDGAALAAGDAGGSIQLWDLANLGPPRSLGTGQNDEVASLAFSSDGSQLVSLSSGSALSIVTIDGSQPPQALRGHGDSVRALAIDPARPRLASGDIGGDVRLWDLSSPRGSGITSVLARAPGGLEVAEMQPGHRVMLSSARAGSVTYLTDLGAAGVTHALPGKPASIMQVRPRGDDRYVLTEDDRGRAQRWDLQHLDRTPPPIDIEAAQIGAVNQVSADLRYALIPDGPDTMRRVDLADPAAPALPIPASRHLTLSANGRYVIDDYSANAFRIWDLSDGSARPVRLPDPAPRLLFADNSHLLVGGADGMVRLYSLADLAQPGVPLAGVTAATFQQADVSADQQMLLVSRADGDALLWDLARPEQAPRAIEIDTATSSIAGFSRRALIAVSEARNSVRVWGFDAPAAGGRLAPIVLSMAELTNLPLNSSLSFQLGADGRYLLGRSQNLGAEAIEAWVWDLSQPGQPARPIGVGRQAILQLALSPDGTTLATADSDGLISLWDLSDSAGEPLQLQSPEGKLSYLAFTLDGGALLAASDGTLRRWDLNPDRLIPAACAAAGRNISWAEWQRVFPGRPYATTCPEYPIHPSFLASAYELAKAQQIDAAAARFREAQALDPELKIDPESEAHRVAVEALVQRGSTDLYYFFTYERALSTFQQAQQLDPLAPIGSKNWANLCWLGALGGKAAAMRPACDAAVSALGADSSAEERFRAYDSRALARALAGDLAGARADMEQALASPPATLAPERLSMRQGWLAELRAGRSPYTAELLDQLRGEVIAP